MIPLITSTPTVIATLLRANGTYPENVLCAALRLAGIPPEAPYAEWCEMVPRALTLLLTREGDLHASVS